MQNYKQTDLMSWSSGKIEGFDSKNLVDLENGGLKLIKVDSNAKYPLHLHPEKTEYVYILEGCPKITIGEKSQVGKKNDFFVMPNSIKHSIENPSDSACLLLVGSIKNSNDKLPPT